jgi:hypothetical protein
MHGSTNASQNHRPLMQLQSMAAVVPSPHCSVPWQDIEPSGTEHEPPLLTALGGGHMGFGGGSLQSVIEHTKCAPSQVHVSL